ncbi:MAG: radical SAM protein [Bacteroidales bacterium]|nr:radical SAM protein [Bacteroidales bacterium]
MLKHYTIPIFVPELACPHQCVFCDQRKISGQLEIPTVFDIEEKIKSYLATIPIKRSRVEIGFFGGNFTGIPFEQQKAYLEAAAAFVNGKRVHSIRVSTRPDYINEDILKLLKENKVRTIELGAQSMDDEVLIKSGRGHRVADVEKAAKMIKEAGFDLGLQMMIGLPYDTREKAMHTAQRIVELGANNTRIYPTLVIKGTELEKLYKKKKYVPMRMTEAILWVKDLYLFFEKTDVNVIRIGLHPSEELDSEHSLVAGPYHASFKELVMTEIWKEHLFEKIEFQEDKAIIIYVPHEQLNFAIGHKSENAHLLGNHFTSVKIKADIKLIKRAFYVDYY